MSILLSSADAHLVTNESLRPFLPANAEENPAKKARNLRYSLLRGLSRAIWAEKLPIHGSRFCSRRAIPAEKKKKDGTRVATGMPGHIEVQSRADAGHSYHGLSRCASPLVCPFCSAVIQAHRAQEVMQAGEYMLKHGFQVAMITQTASHSRETSLIDFVARFQAAQRDMKEHKAYKTWQKKTGAKFTIKAVETTDDNPDHGGKRSGWHFHSHTLVFFERDKAFTEAEAAHFTELFQKMWVKALAGVGLGGSIERAAQVDLPRANEKLDGARANENAESVRNLCAYISKAFGWEVSGSRNKKGREAGRRISVWELQAAALTDRPDLLPRYAEYMRAIKGVNWLRWSQGLRQFCGIVEESDKDILERGEAGEETVWTFTNSDFAFVWRQGGQGKILDAADRAGAAGIAEAMRAAMENRDMESGEQLRE